MKYRNMKGIPQEVVNALIKDEYDFVREENKYSVSELLAPATQTILFRRHDDDIEIDASRLVPRLLGWAVHKIIEKGAVKNGLQEERLECSIAGAVVSGRLDIYRDDKIIDVKTTSVWTLYHNPQGREEWLYQTNTYAWLLRKHGFEVNKIEIFVILLGWNIREARIKKGYPQEPLAVLELPLMSDVEIENWLTDRIRQINKLKKLPDNLLPPCDERWNNNIRCKEYCDVCEFCPYYQEHKEKWNAT